MTLKVSGTGRLGEDIACIYLEKRDYKIVERNYLKKWGEIDIVVKNKKELYFIEVKTVTRENNDNVSRETERFRPEDNIHQWKIDRLRRVIQTYLAERFVSPETNWKFGVIVVILNIKDKKARIKFLKDIII